jgi:hypothetical protein
MLLSFAKVVIGDDILNDLYSTSTDVSLEEQFRLFYIETKHNPLVLYSYAIFVMHHIVYDDLSKGETPTKTLVAHILMILTEIPF